MELIKAFGIGYALALATWLFYLAVMHLLPHKDKLHPVAKAHAIVLGGIALALDVLLNVIVGTLAFAKLPQDWLLTNRLRRYLHDESEAAWRRKLAGWICESLLDQFDPSGCHCCED